MQPTERNATVQIGLPQDVSRRAALQWVLAAATASAIPSREAGADVVPKQDAPPQRPIAPPTPSPADGYGADPKMVVPHKPGDLWPLTFDAPQRAAAAALADVILPADQYGPAASAVGVPAMLDEWISAPYPQQKGDRPPVLALLAWIDAEAQKRFGKPFAGLTADPQHAICDDICYPELAKPLFVDAARQFSRFRSIAAGAYYATPEGWQAIGYIGNTPLPSFEGPPPEVLARLGVTQTVG